MEDHEKPDIQNNSSETEKKEEYEFLQETIKDNTKQKKRVFLKYAALGLVFGMTASLGFFALKPLIEDRFDYGTEQVTIPQEEPETEIETTPEPEEELAVEDYREMNEVLTEIGEEASKGVAEVTGVRADVDWQETDQGKNSVSGIIVAENGPEYLIFASTDILDDCEKIKVKFVDGKTYEAHLKKADETIGYGVYAVQKSELSEGTKKKIAVATLGMTGSVQKGNTIIAVGNPFGYSGGMGFGVVASNEKSVQREDGEYRLIYTDITGAENGSGALINIKGEVVGVIDQRVSSDDDANHVVAYGISDMKGIIEHLSNGVEIPYIGITGVTVSETVTEEQGIPAGIYVQSVSPDSPAMAAGIQSGDVITDIEEESVVSLKAYHTILMKQRSGETVTVHGKRKGSEEYVDIEYDVTIGTVPSEKK